MLERCCLLVLLKHYRQKLYFFQDSRVNVYRIFASDLPGGSNDGGVEASVARYGHRQRDQPARPAQHIISKGLRTHSTKMISVGEQFYGDVYINLWNTTFKDNLSSLCNKGLHDKMQLLPICNTGKKQICERIMSWAKNVNFEATFNHQTVNHKVDTRAPFEAMIYQIL